MANPNAYEDPLNPSASLRRHWPEYLMEAGEAACYLFSACALATLLWHPASPLQSYLHNEAARRMLVGIGTGATIILIVHSPWGKQSGAHFNPAVTLAFCRLGRVPLWDAFFYCAAQLTGAVAGVALATLVLLGAPAHDAVRYGATLPGTYGGAATFLAEVAVSFLLMATVLFTSSHGVLAAYTRYFISFLLASGTALLSGMSTNPARTFGPAVFGSYWQGLWIYLTAPVLGMLAAGEIFLAIRGGKGPSCAKLDHHNDKRCIFCDSKLNPAAVTPAVP